MHMHMHMHLHTPSNLLGAKFDITQSRPFPRIPAAG